MGVIQKRKTPKPRVCHSKFEEEVYNGELKKRKVKNPPVLFFAFRNAVIDLNDYEENQDSDYEDSDREDNHKRDKESVSHIGDDFKIVIDRTDTVNILMKSIQEVFGVPLPEQEIWYVAYNRNKAVIVRAQVLKNPYRTPAEGMPREESSVADVEMPWEHAESKYITHLIGMIPQQVDDHCDTHCESDTTGDDTFTNSMLVRLKLSGQTQSKDEIAWAHRNAVSATQFEHVVFQRPVTINDGKVTVVRGPWEAVRHEKPYARGDIVPAVTVDAVKYDREVFLISFPKGNTVWTGDYFRDKKGRLLGLWASTFVPAKTTQKHSEEIVLFC